MTHIDTETIWQDMHQALQAFIYRRVSNMADTDDILQDVFTKIHHNLGTLQETERLQSWVYQICRNAIIDYYRRQDEAVEIPETFSADSFPEQDLSQEIAQCLRPLVARLPEKYQQAIYLTEFESLTQKAMSQRLGLSISGAKSRVQRGRQALKRLLLTCCDIEFDRSGQVLDYQPKQHACGGCDGS